MGRTSSLIRWSLLERGLCSSFLWLLLLLGLFRWELTVRTKSCVLVCGGGREKVGDNVPPWVAAQVCCGVTVIEAGMVCLGKL